MFKYYNYLFYKVLRVIELLDDEMPSFIALCVLGIINAFQLVILWSIILYFFPSLDLVRTNFTGLIIAIVIFGSNYLMFEYKGNWRKIYEQFEQESKRHNIVGSILVFIYIIGSIWVCFKISGPWIIDNF